MEPANAVHAFLDIIAEIMSGAAFAATAVQTGDSAIIFTVTFFVGAGAVAGGVLFARVVRGDKTGHGALADVATFVAIVPVISGAILVWRAPEMIVLYTGTLFGAISEVAATIWELTSCFGIGP